MAFKSKFDTKCQRSSISRLRSLFYRPGLKTSAVVLKTFLILSAAFIPICIFVLLMSSGSIQKEMVDSSESLSLMSTFNNQDTLDTHIKAILVPRVSGTEGNSLVRQYIVDALEANDYEVELDEFVDSTPFGKVNFSNIIASSNPKACKHLVLACHYDSKMMDGFLGAMDSAVPCAMLLTISETFKNAYRPSTESRESPNDDFGLKFIFFDGEEAFVTWSATDSLYGSRHLAAKWAKQSRSPVCASEDGSHKMVKCELDSIELLVLLDLIGPSDTSFVLYNSGDSKTKLHYETLRKYEKSHLLKSGVSQSLVPYNMAFKNRRASFEFVEDDHVPFKKRGVKTLLLLASPFPKDWHTVDDNYSKIDFPLTRRILHVMEEFVANYPSRKT